MSEIEDEKTEPGTILHEIQAGYMLGERLLKTCIGQCFKEKIVQRSRK